MKKISTLLLMVLSLHVFAYACDNDEILNENDTPAKEKREPADLTVYHLGNSLTRNIPVERLQQLFESEGGSYDYGIQLGGGHQLDQHLSKRNHGNAPGEGKYNIVEPYGEYDNAFKNYKFDAVVFQPYNSELDKEIKVTDRWPYFEAGAIQAASEFIDYARAETEPGDKAWHRIHANTENIASENFYIYATWPKAEQILEFEEPNYAAFYEQPFEGGSIHCNGYFEQLVNRLNEMHPELSEPVKLIPAGKVLAELDKKIRNGKLPGISEFYERNQDYYIESRRNNNKGTSPYDPDTFQPEKGVLNFYADGVHMNDQPHNGKDSGTIGSYCAAITIYAVLTGQTPVGLTAEPYEMFDPDMDEELIEAIQKTAWEVVNNEPLTGVK